MLDAAVLAPDDDARRARARRRDVPRTAERPTFEYGWGAARHRQRSWSALVAGQVLRTASLDAVV
jgi:hypothetical protein